MSRVLFIVKTKDEENLLKKSFPLMDWIYKIKDELARFEEFQTKFNGK